MNERGWKTAALRDIPGVAGLPGFSADEYQKGMAERAPHILERWRDAGERFKSDNRRTHAVRHYFGVEAFGVNAFEAHEGELLVVPHDEVDEGERQEELYLVVEGRAKFTCDGESVELGPGEALFARPGVKREAIALESPTMLFMVGGRAGEPYSPPIWAYDFRR